MRFKWRKLVSGKPYIFTNEEIERLQRQFEEETVHTKIVGLLDCYSASFADWSITISDAIQETIARKQQLNMDCKKEMNTLDNLSSFFTELASLNGTLSEWHQRLKLSNELTEKMIKEGHP